MLSEYTGTLTLVEVISGNCTPAPPGAVYPLSVSGGQVSFAYDPRFDTVLAGRVAPDGTFQASAPTSLGPIKMTGQIKLQHRYMQIEGMAELTPPLIDPDPAKLPPLAA